MCLFRWQGELMPNDHQLPYGYQLSFFERLKLRLKKLNFRLSMGISISIFAFGGLALLIKNAIPESQLLYWQKLFAGMLFLLFGFQGLIWTITGEMKDSANRTRRGKWVSIVGIVVSVICLSVVMDIILNSVTLR